MTRPCIHCKGPIYARDVRRVWCAKADCQRAQKRAAGERRYQRELARLKAKGVK